MKKTREENVKKGGIVSDVLSAILNIENSSEVLKPSEPSKGLKKFSRDHDRALKMSKRIAKNEKRKFGGNPLPWEPGGEKYFKRYSTDGI